MHSELTLRSRINSINNHSPDKLVQKKKKNLCPTTELATRPPLNLTDFCEC